MSELLKALLNLPRGAPKLSFTFAPEKAIEAILYLASRLEDPGRHNITHLLYFADKTSLERYGRFICGDDYYAMQYGPVPTNCYELLKAAETTDHFGFKTFPNTYKVQPLRGPNLDLLSESDIICLEKVVQMYGDLPFWRIRDESHDEAWSAAWAKRGDKNTERIPLESIVAELENPDELLSFLSNRHST